MHTVQKILTKSQEFILQNLDTILQYALYLSVFLVPFLIGHPQILVGILVNTLILFSAFKYGLKKTLPMILLPSIAAYTRGILFGGATIFLIYFIPFIIASNGIYTLVSVKVENKTLGILAGSLLKVSILYSIANIFVNSEGFPTIFLKTMGMNQLITALIGGILALTIVSITKEKFK
jgi:hypothetical protein